ncbi:AbrB family transcriptional regulator [Halobacteriales archaeon QS_1_68_20]|nr:MAG: AbrB family transcriptional regulator [Halobacteriales archaeon QS_1_68_20]
MSNPELVGEGRVSGDQVAIPASVRRALEIEDGDVFRWHVEDSELQVEVIRQRQGVFEDFEPGESDEPVDAVEAHDTFGLE